MQRRFSKRIPGLASCDYKTRLTELQLDSLELRRLRQDLVYVYKILFGLVEHCRPINDFFVLCNTVHNVNTRGHAYKLYPANSRVDVRKYFFANRVVNPWNSLPAEPKHFQSICSFKRFIRNVNLSDYVSLGF